MQIGDFIMLLFPRTTLNLDAVSSHWKGLSELRDACVMCFFIYFIPKLSTVLRVVRD